MITKTQLTRHRPWTGRLTALTAAVAIACGSLADANPGKTRASGRAAKQKAQVGAIQQIHRLLREDGKLDRTDRALLTLVGHLARSGIDIGGLLADEGSYLNWLLEGVRFGSIHSPVALRQFARLVERLIADGELDANDTFILTLTSIRIENDGGLTSQTSSLIDVLEKLAAAGLDLASYTEENPSLVSLLFELVGGIKPVTLPQELCELIDQLAADGSLDSNDLFTITLYVFTLENSDGAHNPGNASLVAVLRKLAAAGVDLAAYTEQHSSLISSLLELANSVPPIPIPPEFCDLIDELAADGTLDSNDLFTLTMFAATFGNSDGQSNAASQSLVTVLRKLAAAGIDLATYTESYPTLVASLFHLVNDIPPIPIPQEFCDLIDELAADGSLDTNDLYILSLYAAMISGDQGATAAHGSLVAVLRKLDSLGIDLPSLDPSLVGSLLEHVRSGQPIPPEFCDLVLALAFDDGLLNSSDLLALSLAAEILEETGNLDQRAIVFAEMIRSLSDSGLDVTGLFAAPDSFLLALFEAVQGHELTLAEIEDIRFALENFLIDHHLDEFERAVLEEMVAAAMAD